MTTEELNIEQRIERLKGDQSFAAYTNARDQSLDGSLYACFMLNRDDLQNIIKLANVCQRANAQEITTYFIAHWSEADLRTELDRLEVTPTSHPEDQIEVSLQLRSYVSNNDDQVFSDVWRLDEMMTAIEMAIARGDNEIWVGHDPALHNDQEQIDYINGAKESFSQPLQAYSPAG